uniref:Galactolipid galactosyltransferase, putative n=1 Tax=Arundo donax TaxID=35708 RepID=A0A0A9DS16_ARUDO
MKTVHLLTENYTHGGPCACCIETPLTCHTHLFLCQVGQTMVQIALENKQKVLLNLVVELPQMLQAQSSSISS